MKQREIVQDCMSKIIQSRSEITLRIKFVALGYN